MTFKEYCRQPIDKITRNHGVKVSDDDIQRAYYNPGLKVWVITLKGVVLGKQWEYKYLKKDGSNCLWVPDEHGNPIRRSCFVYAGTKLLKHG